MSKLHGAREHLAKAASELSAGHFAGSVRESINAVESVVRVLEPDGDFGKALSKLEKKVNIHGGLKAGFLVDLRLHQRSERNPTSVA
jgi:hypothetical protein